MGHVLEVQEADSGLDVCPVKSDGALLAPRLPEEHLDRAGDVREAPPDLCIQDVGKDEVCVGLSHTSKMCGSYESLMRKYDGWSSPQLHTQLVDVLKADVCQPSSARAEIFQVELQVDVLVATVAEDDVADAVGHRAAAGGEGSEERVEHRTESLCSEGSGCKARQLMEQ